MKTARAMAFLTLIVIAILPRPALSQTAADAEESTGMSDAGEDNPYAEFDEQLNMTDEERRAQYEEEFAETFGEQSGFAETPPVNTPLMPAEDWEQRMAAAMSSGLEYGGTGIIAEGENYQNALDAIHSLRNDPEDTRRQMDYAAQSATACEAATARDSRLATLDANTALAATRRRATRGFRDFVALAEEDGIWTAHEISVHDEWNDHWNEVWEPTAAEQAGFDDYQAVRAGVRDELKRRAVDVYGGFSEEAVASRQAARDAYVLLNVPKVGAGVLIDVVLDPIYGTMMGPREAGIMTQWLYDTPLTFTGTMADMVWEDMGRANEAELLAENEIQAAEDYLNEPGHTPEEYAAARDFLQEAKLSQFVAEDEYWQSIALVGFGASADFALLGLGAPTAKLGGKIAGGIKSGAQSFWGWIKGAGKGSRFRTPPTPPPTPSAPVPPSQQPGLSQGLDDLVEAELGQQAGQSAGTETGQQAGRSTGTQTGQQASRTAGTETGQQAGNFADLTPAQQAERIAQAPASEVDNLVGQLNEEQFGALMSEIGENGNLGELVNQQLAQIGEGGTGGYNAQFPEAPGQAIDDALGAVREARQGGGSATPAATPGETAGQLGSDGVRGGTTEFMDGPWVEPSGPGVGGPRTGDTVLEMLPDQPPPATADAFRGATTEVIPGEATGQTASDAFRGATTETMPASGVDEFGFTREIPGEAAGQTASDAFRGATTETMPASGVDEFGFTREIPAETAGQSASDAFRGATTEAMPAQGVDEFGFTREIPAETAGQSTSDAFRGATTEAMPASGVDEFGFTREIPAEAATPGGRPPVKPDPISNSLNTIAEHEMTAAGQPAGRPPFKPDPISRSIDTIAEHELTAPAAAEPGARPPFKPDPISRSIDTIAEHEMTAGSTSAASDDAARAAHESIQTIAEHEMVPVSRLSQELRGMTAQQQAERLAQVSEAERIAALRGLTPDELQRFNRAEVRRQLYEASKVADDAGDIANDMDLLPSAAEAPIGSLSKGLTQAQINYLFTTGVELTRGQLQIKIDYLRWLRATGQPIPQPIPAAASAGGTAQTMMGAGGAGLAAYVLGPNPPADYFPFNNASGVANATIGPVQMPSAGGGGCPPSRGANQVSLWEDLFPAMESDLVYMSGQSVGNLHHLGDWLDQFFYFGPDRHAAVLTYPLGQTAAVQSALNQWGFTDTESNLARLKQAKVNDPYFQNKGSWGQKYADQWAIQRVGFTAKKGSPWDAIQKDGAPIVVAVIDSGIDWRHPDFSPGNLWKNRREVPGNGLDDDDNGYVDDLIGWNFLGNNNLPWDRDGHGTMVSGIIAATTGNGMGIAGINSHARIMVLKALNRNGVTRASYVAEAILYAVNNGARVINLSVGGKGVTRLEQMAVDYAISRGVVVVVAAGNGAVDVEDFAAAGLDNVITVAATDVGDQRTGYSNWGTQVDIAAPGDDVLGLRARGTDLMANVEGLEYEAGSHLVGDGELYYRASGTSFSAPIVTGVASLLMSRDPALSGEEVRRILIQSAQDIGPPGRDQLSGYGMVDSQAALRADPEFFIDVQISGVAAVQDAGKIYLEILGSLDGNQLKSGWLEYGAGTEPDKWKRLKGDLKKPVDETSLGRIPAEELGGESTWTVRLIGEHANGQRREYRFQVDLN